MRHADDPSFFSEVRTFVFAVLITLLARSHKGDGDVFTNTTISLLPFLFKRIGFDVDPGAKVGNLPVSQQQMVEIARALAHEARIVVMDEPGAYSSTQLP